MVSQTVWLLRRRLFWFGLFLSAPAGQHVSQLAALERKQKRAKETLLSVTQENTECLAQIAELSARQFQLEKELNSSGAGVAVADAGPTIRQEVSRYFPEDESRRERRERVAGRRRAEL